RACLALGDFEVSVVTNGLDCVAGLRSFRSDILVLEPELLWGAGEGVLARMREEEDVPAVPVILLVASDRELPRGTPPLPVRSILQKPLPPQELAARIRLVLWAASAYPAPTSTAASPPVLTSNCSPPA